MIISSLVLSIVLLISSLICGLYITWCGLRDWAIAQVLVGLFVILMVIVNVMIIVDSFRIAQIIWSNNA